MHKRMAGKSWGTMYVAIDKQALHERKTHAPPPCTNEKAVDMAVQNAVIVPESRYEEWLCYKVAKTLAHVAAGTTQFHEHGDAMSLLKDRLEARIRKAG